MKKYFITLTLLLASISSAIAFNSATYKFSIVNRTSNYDTLNFSITNCGKINNYSLNNPTSSRNVSSGDFTWYYSKSSSSSCKIKVQSGQTTLGTITLKPGYSDKVYGAKYTCQQMTCDSMAYFSNLTITIKAING